MIKIDKEQLLNMLKIEVGDLLVNIKRENLETIKNIRNCRDILDKLDIVMKEELRPLE